MPDDEVTLGLYNDTDLRRLDAAMNEPHAVRAAENARTYNVLLAHERVTDEEAAGIVRRLDEEWGFLNNAPVMLTGKVLMPGADGTPILQEVEDVPFISKGFNIALDPDGQLLDSRKVMYYFLYPLSEERRAETGHAYMGCYADIDDVAITTHGASFERATAWLSVFEPALVEEIDTRVLNAEGSEANAIMSLKGVDVPLPKDDEELAIACISTYLDKIIEYDEQVPYGIKLNGVVFVHLHGEAFTPSRIRNGRILGKIEHMLPVRNGDAYELALTVEQVRGDKSQKGNDLVIPLSSLISVTSIREAYYGG